MEAASGSTNGSMCDQASRENHCRSIPWMANPASVSESSLAARAGERVIMSGKLLRKARDAKSRAQHYVKKC
jgi:hypothetical protein